MQDSSDRRIHLYRNGGFKDCIQWFTRRAHDTIYTIRLVLFGQRKNNIPYTNKQKISDSELPEIGHGCRRGKGSPEV